jgi:molybdate transport system substrate-binding protein
MVDWRAIVEIEIGVAERFLSETRIFMPVQAADTKKAEAAKAFITYLTTPAAAVIKAKGMNPG